MVSFISSSTKVGRLSRSIEVVFDVFLWLKALQSLLSLPFIPLQSSSAVAICLDDISLASASASDTDGTLNNTINNSCIKMIDFT